MIVNVIEILLYFCDITKGTKGYKRVQKGTKGYKNLFVFNVNFLTTFRTRNYTCCYVVLTTRNSSVQFQLKR